MPFGLNDDASAYSATGGSCSAVTYWQGNYDFAGRTCAASDSQICVFGRSDVICEYPLKEMLAFHRRNRAEGTILVTQVHNSAQDSTVHSLRIFCMSARLASFIQAGALNA